MSGKFAPITFFLLLSFVPMSAAQEKTPAELDLHGNEYLALAKVNEAGDIVKKSDIKLPLYLVLGHYPDEKIFYGNWVQTKFTFNNNNSPAAQPTGQSFDELRIYNGKVKGTKRLKFHLKKGTDFVTKNVKANILDGGNKLKVKLKGADGKKAKIIFERKNGNLSDIYYGDLTALQPRPSQGYGWNTSIVVQNLSSSDTVTDTVWFGSATVTANQPVTAVVNHMSGNMKRYDYEQMYYQYSNPNWGYATVFPLSGATTGIDVKLNYYRNGQERGSYSGTPVRMGGNGNPPQIGSAVITQDGGNVVAVVNDVQNLQPGYFVSNSPTDNGYVSSYYAQGAGGASSTIYVPMAIKNSHSSWHTYIAVQNVSGSPATVKVTYNPYSQ